MDITPQYIESLKERIADCVESRGEGILDDVGVDYDVCLDIADDIIDTILGRTPSAPPGTLKTFQFSLKGYENDTRNDHLVKWVNAPTREAIERWLVAWELGVENGTDGIDEIGPYAFGDGVDVELNSEGKVVRGEIDPTLPYVFPDALTVVDVKGGVVQEIYTNLPGTVVLVDWDNIEGGDEACEYATVPLHEMDEEEHALVHKAVPNVLPAY